MFVALDGFLIIAVGLILVAGLARRRFRLGRINTPQKGDWAGLASYLLLHRSLRKRRWTGSAHFILFWGFVVFLLVVVLDQVDGLVFGSQSMVVSLLLDIIGGLMLIGAFFLLFRRCLKIIRPPAGLIPRRTVFPLTLLAMILLSGFLAEGVRLAIQNTSFDWSAPIGSLFSIFLMDSPLLMQLMIRLHIYLFLLFTAILPFTFMRHAASGAASVLHRIPNTEYTTPRLVSEEDLARSEQIEDLEWRQYLDIEACVSCGRCQEYCPATLSGKPLRPASLMQEIHGLMESVDSKGAPLVELEAAISPETLWSCTHCQACIEHCPVYGRPMDMVSAMRRHRVLSRGKLPQEARPMIRNLELFGDTMGKGAAHRLEWAMEDDIPVVPNGNRTTKPLLWIGCSGSFHPGYSQTMRSLLEIFKSANFEYEVLGKKERCCGEPARRLGEEMLFRDLALKNIETFKQYSVSSVITGCPHCYQTLKNEYPKLGGDFQVRHATEVIWELIRDGRIAFGPSPVQRRIAVHDPCYLGRGNRLYQPIRSICESLPGITTTELPRNREDGFCCGGGGGRMWLRETGPQSVSQLRAEEIVASGVESAVTACPYCKIMLEDGIGTLESDNPPKIRDVIDLVAYSL
ncbi:MAG: (Fe-S)-binding protein [Proteobacteria bacterium]|nr:(Fe-S)-binding protein [Pseudomonadota bacterium]